MTDEMRIEDYLAQGGVLTSPGNVTPRYRAELLRLMATFVDSELAGAAGFADMINAGPGIRERIAAARIVSQKLDHAEKVLKIMGEFGVNAAIYANHHPWTERLDRAADIGAARSQHDMRLAVFNYPLAGWADAVVMNLLMGRAVAIQLQDFARISYQPLAEVFRDIAPVETRHAELAEAGLTRLVETTGRAELQASVDYWWPRVAVSFGGDRSKRADLLRAFGLRHTDNADQRARWADEVAAILSRFGLRAGA